jgi:hypothetical protein
MATEQKSPLLEEIVEEILSPDYSTAEKIYLKGLRKRLEYARNARDTQHEEFDGMDYISYYTTNERLANTYIQPKLNREDSNFQSGTIRTKLTALLASVVNLDLSGDISAFDKNGYKIQSLGDAMEDITLKTNELDNDDDKKMMRQYELLKHGTVFVEEIWDERKKKEKKLNGKFTGKLDIKWDTKIKDAFARPSRNIIPGINVYLGDITKYSIADQPYIFTVDSMPYDEAKTIFGEWDRWKNVPKKLKPESESANNWRLLEVQENYVEIIRYQDKWNNEFAIKINGVLMTPVGLPLPWGYEDYNIAQQNLEPINSKFSYGKSLVFRIRNKVAILDEMMKLGVLKTQKSFVPPKFNLSGRILSSRNFMPGKVNNGIDPRQVYNADDKEVQGVTPSELSMINELQDSINSETTSPTFQGQNASGNPTATEIVELQRQAKQILGLTVFSMSMLEWKLEWLRLQNNLANWFNPEDQVVDDTRGEIKNKYRQVNVERPIEGEGMGRRMIIPTDQPIPSGQTIMKAENILSDEQGVPVRLVFLNPEEVTSSKLCWQIVVRPRERRSSETEKLMFRAEFTDAQAFGPTLNVPYWQEKFSSVWNEDPNKAFKSPEQLQAEQSQLMPSGQPSPLSPGVNLPSPEKAMGKQIQSTLMGT